VLFETRGDMKDHIDGRGYEGIQIVSKHRLNRFGTTQLRCIQPSEYLRSRGCDVRLGELYRSIPLNRRLVIIHRALLDEYTEKFIAFAKAIGNAVIYDTDDLLFDWNAAPHLAKVGRARYGNKVERYRDAMMASDVVLVATEYLGAKARVFHADVRLMRNGLSWDFLKSASGVFAARESKQTERLTIAYLSGSSSHDRDFALVDQTLVRLLTERKNLHLIVVGPVTISDKLRSFGGRVDDRRFVPYEKFADIFREVDINLAPLELDEEFCRAKSELKYIEAGACGVPTVASPTPAFRFAISHRRNGALAEEERWYEEISDLLDDQELRKMMGEAARQHVLENYAPDQRAIEWQDLVEDLWASYGGTRLNSKWHPKRLVMRTELERLRLLREVKLGIRSIAIRVGLSSPEGSRKVL
jgi:glycosyltransferase involved in cell wall biosynthesis